MQVGVDRDQTVHQLRQEAADDLLADDLARVKGDVLAHVGEVRRHQQDLLGAQLAGFLAHQQQLDQLVVGCVQTAVDDQLCRQLPTGIDGQLQAHLGIGEAMAFDAGGRQATGLGQAQGGHLLIFKIQQQGRHQNSTI